MRQQFLSCDQKVVDINLFQEKLDRIIIFLIQSTSSYGDLRA